MYCKVKIAIQAIKKHAFALTLQISGACIEIRAKYWSGLCTCFHEKKLETLPISSTTFPNLLKRCDRDINEPEDDYFSSSPLLRAT